MCRAIICLCVLSSADAGFPAMHFGCNTSGPENTTQLQLLSRYAMPIIEFRQSCCGVDSWDDEEAVLEAQATALRKQTGARAFVYRNVNAGSMFKLQRAVMEDPAKAYLFLNKASVDPKYNISWRNFNFSVEDAYRFYVQVIVGQAAAEADSAGVFFDGIDGFSCASPGEEQLFNDTIRVFRDACSLLVSKGKSCILSVQNSFQQFHVENTTRCPLPEEAMLEIMGDVPWYRYYQHWMNGFVGHPHAAYSSEICSKMIQNLIREGELGIPAAARAPSTNSAYGTDLHLALGAFLVGATKGSTFGYGSCWFDECWHWQQIYDNEFGVPVAHATVSPDKMRFTRQWSGVDVEVDCERGAATLNFRKSFDSVSV